MKKPTPLSIGGEGFLRLWLLIALAAAVWGVPFQAMRHLLYALPPLILILTPWAGRNAPLLFEYLAAGDSLDEFLRGFPTVQREQAVGVLQWVAQRLHELADEASLAG